MEKWGYSNRNWVNQIDTKLSGLIYTLLIDEKSETLFLGGVDKVLKQFNLRNGDLIKEYNNLEVGKILCLSSSKHLLCVGGMKHFSLIDMGLNKVLTSEPVKTPILCISTSQFCVTKTKEQVKVSLVLSGSNSFFELLNNTFCKPC